MYCAGALTQIIMELYVLSLLLVISVVINQVIVFYWRKKLDKTHEYYNNKILKEHRYCAFSDEIPEDQGALIIKQMHLLKEIDLLKQEQKNYGKEIEREIERRRKGKKR